MPRIPAFTTNILVVQLDGEKPGGFAAQGNFRAIHEEDAGVAAGCAESGSHTGAGQKTQFHQPAGILTRQVDTVEDGGVALAKVHKGRREGFRLDLVATELHLGFSMRRS